MGRLIALGLLLVVLQRVTGADQCDATGPRKDCGYGGIQQSVCQSKGCCYIPAPATTGAALLTLPACFYPNGGDSSFSLSGGLQASGSAQTGSLSSAASTLPQFGTDVSPLNVNIQYITSNIVRVKIGASGRWEVPASIFNVTAPSGSASPPNDAGYNLQTTNSPFSFTITRNGSSSNDAPLFSTKGQRLIFKDQYIEVNSPIPSSATLFGAGEHISATGLPLRRDGTPLTLWNRDCAAADPDQNTYGSWPFLIDVRKGGLTHGVLLMNSNGMDIVITDSKISYRIIGGVADFYFFLGPTPNAVLEQLTYIVGRPMMAPYWSLGLMNSKYGYSTVQQLERVVQSYAYFKIPLETFVTDSQYMDHDQDFTISPDFEPFGDFVAMLNKNGQRWVPILDPPIHIKPGYAAYDSGIAQDVFIKDITGGNYVGQMWPGATHWPDFMNPKTVSWWQTQLQGLNNVAPIDGIWLDMNEVSNYCAGDVCIDPGNVKAANDFICKIDCEWGPNAFANQVKGQRVQLPAGIYDPPYRINNENSQANISDKTLAVTARHYDGTLEYNVHNLYAHYEVMATAKALRAIRNKRHFIFTRSSFVGSGAYTAHWTGDSASTWQDLRWQVNAVLQPGLVGISFAGADICGFQNIATAELCARWISVGAWQPFTRDHHAQSFQELYRWPLVAEVSRKVLGWRLKAMPYLYTAFYDSHTFGCPIARPLWFNFPSDSTTLQLHEQWMMGDALLISPIVHKGAISTETYFPAGTWYNMYNYSTIDASSGSRTVTVQANVTDNTPIYILGGNILPFGQGGMTTTEARTSPLKLVVALANATGNATADRCSGKCSVQEGAVMQACGHMYLDEGEELSTGTAKDNLLSFSAFTAAGGNGGNSTTGQLVLSWPGAYGGQSAGACMGGIKWPGLDSIVLLGTSVDPSSITLQGGGADVGAPQAVKASSIATDPDNGAVTLSGLNQTLSCGQDITLHWSTRSGVPQTQAFQG
ncbi:g109 [Coccomyxa viridis]|uniref:Maltase n=1 Tax=Coccomyxa viridis TaxID=1274662 RepID=A0ABP1FGX1_9CHLO